MILGMFKGQTLRKRTERWWGTLDRSTVWKIGGGKVRCYLKLIIQMAEVHSICMQQS